MLAVDPPIPSFGQLAIAALAHPTWPNDTQPKPRSLATLFSKLDRAHDIDWLRDRLSVQHVLAELLHRPLSDIRLSMGEIPTPGDDRFLRLDDVRFSREIDLVKEALPPGIPRAAYDPPSWGPSWWVAGPGAGKTITGRWLECRGLAHYALLAQKADLAKVPPRGPLFLELDSIFESSDFTLDDWRELRADTRPILIASVAPPPAALSIERIQSPPTLSYLPELIAWVTDRLDDTGHFKPDRAEQWLKQVAVPSNAIHTWGDALGLIGMLDEVHPRSLLAKSLDEIGEHFVARRVREASENTTNHPRLAQDAYPALLDCAARCLISGERALDKEHDLDVWTSLLSTPQAENIPDPAWFTSALSGSLGQKVARRDLARAARNLQPSAFALARSLSAAQLLVPSSSNKARHADGALRKLRPLWLTSLLTARAATQLMEYSCLDWGRVLLSGKDADRIMGSLFECAVRGHFSPYARLLDDFDAEQAECVAALEGATIAAGLAQLEGHEIPDEIAEGLLSLSSEMMIILGPTIAARFTQPAHVSKFYTNECWVVALASLCQETRLSLQHFDPARTTNLGLIQFVLSTIEQSIRLTTQWMTRSQNHLFQEKQVVGQLKLLGELYETHHSILSIDGQSTGGPTIAKPIYLTVVRAWDNLAALYQSLAVIPLGILISYAESLGQKRADIIAQIWKLVALVTEPDELCCPPELKAALWGALPSNIMQERIAAGLAVNWSYIRPHQFTDLLSQESLIPMPSQAALFCPLDLAVDLVAQDGPLRLQTAALRELIQRAPARFASFVRKHLDSTSQFTHLLESCPPNATAIFSRFLPNMDELMVLPPPIIFATRSLLHRAVTERHTNFEECYQNLNEIEHRLRPLRKIP